jgi:iron complex transport system substrate-binding protein
VPLLSEERPAATRASPDRVDEWRREYLIHGGDQFPHMGITDTQLAMCRRDRTGTADRLQEHRLDRADDDLAIDRHAQLQIRSEAPVASRHSARALHTLPLYLMSYIVASEEGRILQRRAILILLLLCWSGATLAGTIVDATGRTVEVPEQIVRVLPAGPPAAILLAVLAPDLMLGWTSPVSDNARALLAPETARLPQVPRLTGRDDVTDKIVALKPDLILDYGTIAPRYSDLARKTQQRTGIPTVLLDGSLAEVPRTFRMLGDILHRRERAETLARFAEALLALPVTQAAHPRVLCARGPDGLSAVAPGTDLAEIFNRLGWQLVAPAGQGLSRQVSLDDIRALDPDIVMFTDPVMSSVIAHSDAWRSLHAVRDGHAFVVPSMPFGWLDEPPSINRLLGLAWLGGGDPRTLAALFNATVYGHVLTVPQLETLLTGVRALQP